MKFLATTVAALAMANTAFAYRFAALAASRLKGPSINRHNRTVITNGVAAQASSNWAGAAIVTTGVTSVTGTFTVPTPRTPPGGSSGTEYCGAAWAGIDGDTCQTGLIQTGVFWCVLGSELGYEAWHEWIPQASVPFNNIAVNPGDSITVTITKTSTTGGTTTLVNNSNGESGKFTFSHESSGTLCGENAEWIVEDFESGGSLVPFANFGTVTFTGATAVVNGATTTPGGAGASNIFLEQNGQTLTSTTFTGSTVQVSYV